jgi:hypothetical protein
MLWFEPKKKKLFKDALYAFVVGLSNASLSSMDS